MNDFDPKDGAQPDPDDLRKIWEEMLKQGFDPEALAAAGGFDGSPESLRKLFENIQGAFLLPTPPEDGSGVNWAAAGARAKEISKVGSKALTEAEKKKLLDTLGIANLWLNEATDIAEKLVSIDIRDITDVDSSIWHCCDQTAYNWLFYKNNFKIIETDQWFNHHFAIKQNCIIEAQKYLR